MEHWAAAGAGAEPQGSCEPQSPLGRVEPSCNLTPDFFQSAPLLDLLGMIRELNGGFSPLPTNKINRRFPPRSPQAAGRREHVQCLPGQPKPTASCDHADHTALFGSE